MRALIPPTSRAPPSTDYRPVRAATQHTFIIVTIYVHTVLRSLHILEEREQEQCTICIALMTAVTHENLSSTLYKILNTRIERNVV